MIPLHYTYTNLPLVRIAMAILEIDLDGFLTALAQAEVEWKETQPEVYRMHREGVDRLRKLAQAAQVFQAAAERELVQDVRAN